jgi:hypothetical protein
MKYYMFLIQDMYTVPGKFFKCNSVTTAIDSLIKLHTVQQPAFFYQLVTLHILLLFWADKYKISAVPQLTSLSH